MVGAFRAVQKDRCRRQYGADRRPGVCVRRWWRQCDWALLAIYAFAIQIYADFSGYTDIARGISKMMGIELMVNFRRPYFATNPREFWQRWHISLSEWLRDYLYISLGGSRQGAWRTYRNLMLTMLIGGLWHGASWMFVLWGGIHGLVLVVHRGWLPLRNEYVQALSWLVGPLRWFLFFHIVCLAWVFFRAKSMVVVWDLFKNLGGGLSLAAQDRVTLQLMLLCAGPLLVLDVLEELHARSSTKPVVFAFPVPVRGFLVAALLLFLAIAGAPAGAEFIYFQF